MAAAAGDKRKRDASSFRDGESKRARAMGAEKMLQRTRESFGMVEEAKKIQEGDSGNLLFEQQLNLFRRALKRGALLTGRSLSLSASRLERCMMSAIFSRDFANDAAIEMFDARETDSKGMLSLVDSEYSILSWWGDDLKRAASALGGKERDEAHQKILTNLRTTISLSLVWGSSGLRALRSNSKLMHQVMSVWPKQYRDKSISVGLLPPSLAAVIAACKTDVRFCLGSDLQRRFVLQFAAQDRMSIQLTDASPCVGVLACHGEASAIRAILKST